MHPGEASKDSILSVRSCCWNCLVWWCVCWPSWHRKHFDQAWESVVNCFLWQEGLIWTFSDMSSNFLGLGWRNPHPQIKTPFWWAKQVKIGATWKLYYDLFRITTPATFKFVDAKSARDFHPGLQSPVPTSYGAIPGTEENRGVSVSYMISDFTNCFHTGILWRSLPVDATGCRMHAHEHNRFEQSTWNDDNKWRPLMHGDASDIQQPDVCNSTRVHATRQNYLNPRACACGAAAYGVWAELRFIEY